MIVLVKARQRRTIADRNTENFFFLPEKKKQKTQRLVCELKESTTFGEPSQMK